jgi:hypothetical protein
MSTDYTCRLDLSPETLSAWRDQQLPVDEERRLSAHFRECYACREQLAGFERQAQSLRTERVPEPDERLWQSIHAGMLGSPRRARFGWTVHAREFDHPDRHRVGALAAVAVVALVALGFAAVYGAFVLGRSPVAHPTPTPTGRALRWQRVTWPQGQAGPGSASLGPERSPSDGNTAYLCDGASGQAIQHIWVTHNFAAQSHATTWTFVGGLAVEQPISLCTVAVDSINTSTLLATIVTSAGAMTNYVSFDGGVGWQNIIQTPLYFSGGTATYQGKVYAITSTIAPTYPQFGNYTLRVSTDDMSTWQPVPGGHEFDAFWLNPSNGEILAHDRNSRLFFYSDDGGQTWHGFHHPVAFDTASFVVRAPVAPADLSWTICGLALPVSPSDWGHLPDAAECTQDLGQTYSRLANLPDTPAGVQNPAGQMRMIGITANGSVLAMLAAEGASKSQTTSQGYTLWRLPPGRTAWQSLGTTPQYSVTYVAGVLLASPSSEVVMRACPTCPTDEADYVAAYG